MAWKTLDSQTILNERYVKVNKDRVLLENGSVIPDFYTVTVQDAAMIMAITVEGDVLLKKEYRYACGENVIECPAGMIENDETPLSTAKRELLEETGYTSASWTYLGPTWESTSKMTNIIHLFLAEDCVKTSDQQLDPNEHLDVINVSMETAIDMVMSNEVCANSSAHAILKVARLKNEL